MCGVQEERDGAGTYVLGCMARALARGQLVQACQQAGEGSRAHMHGLLRACTRACMRVAALPARCTCGFMRPMHACHHSRHPRRMSSELRLNLSVQKTWLDSRLRYFIHAGNHSALGIRVPVATVLGLE